MAGLAGFFFFRPAAVPAAGGNPVVHFCNFTVISIALGDLPAPDKVGAAAIAAIVFVLLDPDGPVQF